MTATIGTHATHPIEDLLELLRAVEAGKVHRSMESGALIRKHRQFSSRVESKAYALADAGLLNLETLTVTELGTASLAAGRVLVDGLTAADEESGATTTLADRRGAGRWPERQPHQARALTALTETFGQVDRAQLHWACGTGKTFVGRWLAEDFGAALSVVFVPSLALIAQALAEWQAASDWPFEALVVCSDSTAADSWRVDPGWWASRGVQVTTDAKPVATWLARPSGAVPRVVFSTYHSAPVVAQAVRLVRSWTWNRLQFDLMVCDEAHRLAGNPDDRFRAVLDDGQIPARKRLFATATPIFADRGGDLLSMDDMALFGPVADRLDFAEAIATGLLVDYQVLVLDAGVQGNAGVEQSVISPAALVAAAREGVSRLITFHSRVATAREFAAAIDDLTLPDGRSVRAEAVAGTDSSAHRQEVLGRLAAGGQDVLSVVSNARCLTEGINVPAVDGVVFADPRTSDTDIIQAIGRALRPSPGKTRGLIVLPVVVPEGDEERCLDGGDFTAVWTVLRALRSLDPRMAAALDHPASLIAPGSEQHGGVPALVRFDLDGVDLQPFVGRLVEPASGDQLWQDMYDRVAKWAAERGHAAIPYSSYQDGVHIGWWITAQRRAYAAGGLTPERTGRLNAIPGWGWTADMAWWNADHAAGRR